MGWIRVSKTGAIGEIGKGQRPLTDIERELAKVKRELSLAKMERDILKKAAAYFAKESL
jgi:transposase